MGLCLGNCREHLGTFVFFGQRAIFVFDRCAIMSDSLHYLFLRMFSSNCTPQLEGMEISPLSAHVRVCLHPFQLRRFWSKFYSLAVPHGKFRAYVTEIMSPQSSLKRCLVPMLNSSTADT